MSFVVPVPTPTPPPGGAPPRPPPTPPPRGPGLAERLWTSLFLTDQRGPEVLKWVDFGRRLVLAVSGLVLVIGTGLTALSTFQLSRLLEESLRVRGKTIAVAVARAAFVPMTLEDGPTLRALVLQSARQRDVAYIRVADLEGRTWAQAGTAPEDDALTASASILTSHPAGGSAAAAGRVQVVMDSSEIDRRRLALVGTSLVVNGLFVTALLSVGLVFIRNLTLRMQIMVDEAKWVAELRRSNRELEEFAYVASHDLQSPLRKVAGFAELLRESAGGRLGRSEDEYIAFIVEGTRRMQRLIEDLLTYSRAGSRQLVPAKVELAEVVREVLSDLEPATAKAGGRVSVGRLPAVFADRGQMGQLFQNLLTNALKFRGAAPPVVSVSAERSGDSWLISVSDNGIGMEPQYLEKIFKMFSRLHLAKDYEGTGIGLAVVRKIVERHGGRVWAQSEPGRGTTFRFTLGAGTSGTPGPEAGAAPPGGGGDGQ